MMEWKFRKDFEVMPGVTLRFGKDGLHTQFNMEHVIPDKDKLAHQLFKTYDPAHEIKSASIDKLTSDSLQQFKRLLLEAGKSFTETQTLLDNKIQELLAGNRKLERWQRSIFRFMLKKKIARKTSEMEVLNSEVEELKEQLPYTIVHLELDADEAYNELYKNVRKAFTLLNSSLKKWDFTSSRTTNRISERTSASATITRSEIQLSEKHLPILKGSHAALCFHNINGGDLYLYPGFLVVYDNHEEFALINYTDISALFEQMCFIEQDEVPADSEVVGKTWFRVNKDGSPDRRFANNFQIPIAQYGKLHFNSRTGLNEIYCFSNVEITSLFHKAFYDYIETLKKADALLNEFK